MESCCVCIQQAYLFIGVMSLLFLPQYTLRCDLKRPLLAKDLSKNCEFIVHCQVSELWACCKHRHVCNLRCILTWWCLFNLQPQKAKVIPTPVNFSITPDTMQNVREVRNANSNLVLGSLNGFLTVETWLSVSREVRCPSFLFEAI